MAISTLGSVTRGTHVQGASSVTYSHTVPAGTKKLLAVGSEIWPDKPTSVEFNGVALTERIHVSNDEETTIHTLTDPAETTANVVITYAGGSFGISLVQTFQGVDQITPIGNTASDIAPSGNALSATLASNIDDLVLAFAMAYDPGAANSWSWGVGETELDDYRDATEEQVISFATKPGATSVTMTATLASAPDGTCALAMIELNANRLDTVSKNMYLKQGFQ